LQNGGGVIAKGVQGGGDVRLRLGVGQNDPGVGKKV